jgi:peptide deformylase
MTNAPFDLDSWLQSAPSLPPIVTAGALVLRHRALEVPPSLLGSPSLERLVEAMVAVMREAPGVGLAAPQIGVPLRIFVAEDTAENLAHLSPEARALRRRAPLPLTAVVNPRLELAVGARPEGEATFYEGCLSVPGYGALVRRALAARLEGVDPRGRAVSLALEGWPARIAQHEMDHLNGTLYIDRMISRSFASSAEIGRLASVPVADVLSELVGAAESVR